MAAGEPAALSVACSINSGGSGTDGSLTLIPDSGADVQLLAAAHTTGGEEMETGGNEMHTGGGATVLHKISQ